MVVCNLCESRFVFICRLCVYETLIISVSTKKILRVTEFGVRIQAGYSMKRAIREWSAS